MDFSLSTIYNTISKNKERTSLGVQHPNYHHNFVKNGISYESGRLGDYTIYTNSLGFKDKSNRKISHKTDTQRIVFIGDSFTEGILLNYEDTYVGMIDSMLADKDIEVLNAGRVSYSPIIYWRKVKYLIERNNLKFDELVVFIDISDIDDEASYYDISEDGNVISQINPDLDISDVTRDYGISWLISNENIGSIRLFLKEHFIITSFIVNNLHDLFFEDSLEAQSNIELENQTVKDSVDTKTFINTWDYVLNDYRSNWTFDDLYYDQFGEIGKERMIKYMNMLNELCNEKNIELTVVVYPWPSQIWYEDLNSRHVKIWEEWTDDNDVNFINLFPSFIKLNLTETEKLDIMSEYYIPYDLHYNREGNKLIAKEFIKNYFN